ncbi:hypothetical protein DPMN_151881 [Dreissena polymorpha]|uniref:Uncharacterized protein n=1 Tax=Dreissena polymorpha TaxID=45954 RepID=A0A9D4FII5_DREPO|nr:hypothetical protein DPMN_151881 [Dreissena polymorpha]
MMTDEIRSEGCLLLLQNPYHLSDTVMRISCSAADICRYLSILEKVTVFASCYATRTSYL